MPLTKVTAGVIAANAVVDSFGSQSITGDKIGLTAINANNIVNGTITGAKIAAGTITGDDLANDIIRGNNIVAGTITGNLIAANTITGDKIAANTVTGNVLGQNAVSANNIVSGAIEQYQNLSGNPLTNRNRIINGDMMIDQRNAGASVTQPAGGAGSYTVDRWNINGSVTSKFTAQRSTTAPTNFTNSLLITSSAATSLASGDYYYLMQGIEGFNVADLAWGTANAKTVTLSFWVRSSLTGTFGGTLRNLISGATRSYPFTYTINAANTFEYKTITVTGDTTGTWATDNSCSLTVCFSMGTGTTYSGTAGAWAGSNLISATGATSVVGTNGATWYITGVQLEVGSTATPFERRPYTTELQLCQRYYYKVVTAGAAAEVLAPNGFADSTTTAFCWTQFPVSMRTAPTALEQTGTAANYQVRYTGGSSATCSSVPTFNIASVWGARSVFTVASGLTGGQAVALQTAATANIYLAWSAEL